MIVALLSWWDEQPGWLTRCVTPLAGFAGHLIAVDGAYEHINGAVERPRSAGDQVDAVVAACDGAGLGLTLHRPTVAWSGDEVAKRQHMFQLAHLICREGDWLYVVDADEMVTTSPASLDEQLDQAAGDGFEVGTVEMVEPPARGCQPARRFFRWDPTLRVCGRHYHYRAGPDNAPRVLWGNGDDPRVVQPFAVTGFRFEHWVGRRHPFRADAQAGYYNRRKQLGLEADVQP